MDLQDDADVYVAGRVLYAYDVISSYEIRSNNPLSAPIEICGDSKAPVQSSPRSTASNGPIAASIGFLFFCSVSKQAPEQHDNRERGCRSSQPMDQRCAPRRHKTSPHRQPPCHGGRTPFPIARRFLLPCRQQYGFKAAPISATPVAGGRYHRLNGTVDCWVACPRNSQPARVACPRGGRAQAVCRYRCICNISRGGAAGFGASRDI